MDIILVRGLKFSSILGNTSALVTKYVQASACYTCPINRTYWKSKFSGRYPRYRANMSYYHIGLVNHISACQRLRQDASKSGLTLAHYSDSKQSPGDDCQKSETTQKISIFQRMKQMTKDYWHILIPVHVATSIGWVAIFYTAVRNGVDIAQMLEYMSFSEKYVDLVRNSSAGNWAVTYALYKIFTPLRYTVTVGGTTLAIRHLSKLGYVKTPSIKSQPIEPIQSTKCAAEHEAKFKTECKRNRNTESSKS